MDLAASLFTAVQFFFAIVIGLYFWNLLRSQHGSKAAIGRESKKEVEKLRKLREISLTQPLSELTRPSHLEEVVGQEEGIRALKAALCGANPQHVLIYGPPGVGKTAAARLVLEEARRNPESPFKEFSRFVEVDATVSRFDERGIADPLIGSVHDPIYQGAGPMGMAGIPQPKPGAVTKAHGGILFIDEIGELHGMQMNKLLKVLEDRKVFLESAYYSSEDPNVPSHIQDIFQNGLPADFRLVGATTRSPEEMPPALRSRCVEIFFRSLLPDEVAKVARDAAVKVGYPLGEPEIGVLTLYATSGRDAVNLVQISAGLVRSEGRERITVADLQWVATTARYTPRPQKRVADSPQVGVVSGLAVYGPGIGTLLELEVSARKVAPGTGTLTVTGMVEEEEMGGGSGRVLRRRSTARSSVENVLTVLSRTLPVHPRDYDLHVNFPGGIPLDGPSAGVALATAIASALLKRPVDPKTAMTGELSIRGLVCPVGGVYSKIQAAKQAGAVRVIIPKENLQESFAGLGVEVIPVERLEEVLDAALLPGKGGEVLPERKPVPVDVPLTAASASALDVSR